MQFDSRSDVLNHFKSLATVEGEETLHQIRDEGTTVYLDLPDRVNAYRQMLMDAGKIPMERNEVNFTPTFKGERVGAYWETFVSRDGGKTWIKSVG